MSRPRITYLILAIIGAVAPVIFVAGWQPAQMLLSPSWNHGIALLALTGFAGNECVARKYYLPLVALPVAVVFGLGAGLPLYLFLRSRPLD
ncbi:MAG: hypothetical protein L3J33_04835 [Rhodobacteraceae bacterium]|nr:hypothetical protein [Paracoccaceae bacterium]